MESKNRWLIAASGIGIHISIGSVYAYSVMTKPVASVLGLEDPSQVKIAFMTAVFCLGMSAAFLGRLVEKIGPRKSGMISACFYSAGIIGSGFAIQLQSLNLFYLCYGLIGGIGLGIGYITPVSTMVKWFPDKRGLATGMAIMGFGFASMIFGPIMASLFIDHTNSDGQAVYTTASVAKTFWILGSVYFTLIMLSALYICKPADGWKPAHMQGDSPATKKKTEDLAQVSANEALKTQRFYLIWFMMFINISCGIAVISSASPLIQELFPEVTPAKAAAVVGLMGVFNGLGRFAWSTASDFLGRPQTFITFFVIQIVAFYFLPTMTSFALFQVVLFLILTCYGGGFSVMPAFLGDLFGTKQLGAIHGMVLTAWACAGVAGPKLFSYLQSTIVKVAADGQSVPDYASILSVFSGLFIVAFTFSVMMLLNIRKLRAQKNSESEKLVA